jgi:protein-L-isoaspartate(D-aspartate) O-methyltransferase
MARYSKKRGQRMHVSLNAVILLLISLGASASDPFAPARARMIRAIEDDVRATTAELGRPELDSRVMGVMAAVPRHVFVPPQLQSSAYQNRPLPIGYGQTISQPYIVAIMTDLLGVKSGDVVLEVGTGSGYQAAVLSRLVGRVYSVEIIEPLAEQASERLRKLGYRNVFLRHSDGYHGWKEAGPFDAIIVTAAASHVPPPLIQQLKPGGTMMIPVGSPFTTQSLLFVRKTADGRITTRQVLPVAFVPLTRMK